MKWEQELRKEIIKEDGPANKMHGFSFETKVEYINLQTGRESGEVLIKWEFGFGQRIENMREIGIYVTDVIMGDIELPQRDIDNINSDPPEIRGKVGPAELIKYQDGDYELTWSY